MNKAPWYDDRIPASYARAAEKILQVMRRTRWTSEDRDRLAEHLMKHFEIKPPRISAEITEKQDGETNEHAT